MRGVLCLALGPTITALVLNAHIHKEGRDAMAKLAGPRSILQQITNTKEAVRGVEIVSIALLVILVAFAIFAIAVLWTRNRIVDKYEPFTDTQTETRNEASTEVGSAVTEHLVADVCQGENENLSEELAQRAWFAQEVAKMTITSEMWEAMRGAAAARSPIPSSSSGGSLLEDISRTDALAFDLLMGDDPRMGPRSASASPDALTNERAPPALPDFLDPKEMPTHSVSRKLLHPLEKREKLPKKPKSSASHGHDQTQTTS